MNEPENGGLVVAAAPPRTLGLGINGLFHDASVCLLVDGSPRLAVEEERLDRRKHSARFPELGIELCLRSAGVTLDDVQDVAFSWLPRRFLLHQLRLGVTNFPWSMNLFARGASDIEVPNKLRILFGMRRHLTRGFGAGRSAFRMHFVGHHVAHAYDAYSFSPFEEALVLVVDGFGEVASTSLFSVDPRGIRHLLSVPYPHSLGLLYGAMTEYLGFEAMHDEYKVMGLAAYGEDRFRTAFDRLLQTTPDGRYTLDLSYFGFHTHGRNRWYHDRLQVLLGSPPRRPAEPITADHRDIACSLQRALERLGLALAEHAFRLTKARNLCIAGGVAQNVCLNARIREAGLFAEVFVPPAPGDAGTAHGAIQAVYARRTGRRPKAVPHAYLGPRYSRAECVRALARRALAWSEVGTDTRTLARTLADGRLVGVYHGAMEFGPRALGARSILADPRRVEVRDHLNATIKRREGFRPFAPAVPEERASEFFQWVGSAPFMSFVARVRPEKAALIPAVVHVDQTARLQTVRREDNPFFWQLLVDFGEITGVPVLLNTSFNENEPIVCSPDDAVACFERTPLDALFMEGLLVVRPGGVGTPQGRP